MTQPHERSKSSMKKIILNNFIGGIAWGVGITIGATFFLAIFGFFLSQINYVPVVGTFVAQVVEFVADNNQQFSDLGSPQE